MKYSFVVIVLMLACTIAYSQNGNGQHFISQKAYVVAMNKKVKQMQDAWQLKYGIDVHFDGDKSIPYEVQPGLAEKGVTGEPLTYEEIFQIAPVIDAFLQQYPEKFIKENLKHIYLLYELRNRSAFRAGDSLNGLYHHYSPRRIYVALWNNSSRDEQYRSLHHEFSHLLMRTYQSQFPKEEWIRLNDDLPYIGTQAHQNPEERSVELLQSGFVRRYSMHSLDEDFATLVEEYFGDPQAMAKGCRQFPTLNKKTILFEDFYESIGARE
ncbi:MAG: putative zinc-binding metallopeptidase [Verrucomicrobiota bacterium]